MTAVLISKHDAEQKAIAEKRASLEEETEKLLQSFAPKAVKAVIPDVSLGYSYDNGKKISSIYIKIELEEDQLPPNILSRIRAFHALPKCTVNLDEKKVRRDIAAKLEGIGTREERVDALIDDPESRKGIEQMLKLIGK